MDGQLTNCLWLVHHGIPISAAFGVSEGEFSEWVNRSAVRHKWMAIKFSEFAGNTFNLNTMQFEEPK